MTLLDSQVADVTGAAQGIGLAIARTFGDAGARVVVADLDADAAHKAVAELGGDEVALAVALVRALGWRWMGRWVIGGGIAVAVIFGVDGAVY